MGRLHAHRALCFVSLSLGLLACVDGDCPIGYDKVGTVCRRHDAAVDAVSAAEAGPEGDAKVSSTDAGSRLDSGPAFALDATQTASPEAGVAEGATGETGPSSSDAEVTAPPGPECDQAHPCVAGYVCSGGKCMSACTQKQCDPNATCSLMAGAPACTCNSGYVAVNGAGGALTCAADLGCSQLGCSPNATCEVVDQLRRCVCKNGYTGDGKACSPVACPSAATLSIANGTVATPNGAVYNQPANYGCSAGYQLMGMSSRMCGADGTWSGSAPSCIAQDCGALANPAHGKVDTSGGTRVDSPTAKYTCDPGFTLVGSATRGCSPTLLGVSWSDRAPTCLKCGDGVVSPELNEECDPAGPGSNIWTCDPTTCRRAAAYRPCLASTECDSGHTCKAGYCSPNCSAIFPCPSAPNGRLTVTCNTGSTSTVAGPCVLTGCNTEADCPPGLLCNGGTCLGCNIGINPCPSPKTCRMGNDGTYQGHCE